MTKIQQFALCENLSVTNFEIYFHPIQFRRVSITIKHILRINNQRMSWTPSHITSELFCLFKSTRYRSRKIRPNNPHPLQLFSFVQLTRQKRAASPMRIQQTFIRDILSSNQYHREARESITDGGSTAAPASLAPLPAQRSDQELPLLPENIINIIFNVSML